MGVGAAPFASAEQFCTIEMQFSIVGSKQAFTD